ncbi:DUF6199 family natural product biosynthesis protein [Cohnella sp. GCM10027633]|uniref:DUF6199 family natural product biosynthesis protein n=1 Tax=unclassified Cohnella TaxID=2636738 RepID=UPI00362AC697
MIAILSRPYFAEPVFYLDNHLFRLADEKGELAVYRSSTADSVQVRQDGGKRIVEIDGESYTVEEAVTSPASKYRLTYPGGRTYDSERHNGMWWTYDDKGELVLGVMRYAGDNRILSEGEEIYPPAQLVIAAYSEYHLKRGTPELLYLALAAVVFGWCGFRYRKFQDLNFKLSFYWLYVRDPEPTDFYYFMCKVGGIACMLFGIWIAFKAF